MPSPTLCCVLGVFAEAFSREAIFLILNRKLFWFWLPALFVKRITVISNFTKLELEKVVPFAKHKIRVVPNPVNDCYEFSDYNFNTAKPRILLLGTKQNKNLERVIKALDDISCEIVLVGQLTDDQNKFLNTCILKIHFVIEFLN